ncbi:hypothetical protein M885DRAFT_625110 [Pelagophyceae sp. CCMP2097]|nr:hypothetical protein M885DRAFT_625110 [Pelagophyceae sp. CCMP2097]|mmetsp:Transcript_6824/g.22090  ORF Transcript_6824/g.22090 Transcript_6824/m.22090 type:complete len:851 (-) Transcript_6824:59-2611(-)
MDTSFTAGSSKRHDYEVRDVDDADDVEKPYYEKRLMLKSGSAAVSPAPFGAEASSPDPTKGFLNERPSRKPSMPLGEQVLHTRLHLKGLTSDWILSPYGKLMRYWDVVTFAALTFTAIVTPVEVAFSNETTPLVAHEIAIFAINRFVDLIFISDIVLQFFVAYYDETNGSILVKSHSLIRQRYLRSWFTIDFISTIPFDTLGLLTAGTPFLKFLKTLRLLRLLKLARVIRASRILARWEAAAVFTFSYAEISMYKFALKLLMWAHWNACLWGMTAHKDVAQDGWTWMKAFERTQAQGTGRFSCSWGADYRGYHVNEFVFESLPKVFASADGLSAYTGKFEPACVEETKLHFDRHNVMNKYFAALYFAVYTMTGIGYGDITATTFPELVVATFIMIAGAVFWAYMIGEFVTLVGSMDVAGNAFRQQMDELNIMMSDKKFARPLRRRCRMFMLHSKQHQRHAGYRSLEKMMSISLRSEVALANNARFIGAVWFLKSATPDVFVADLSQAVQPRVYAPMEVIDLALTLFVITNGIAARRGRILSKRAAFGLDFMLENLDLVDTVCAGALSYLEVVSLSRERLLRVLEDPAYEGERARIRHSVVLFTVRARFVQIGAAAIERRHAREAREALGAAPDARILSIWDVYFNLPGHSLDDAGVEVAKKNLEALTNGTAVLQPEGGREAPAPCPGGHTDAIRGRSPTVDARKITLQKVVVAATAARHLSRSSFSTRSEALLFDALGDGPPRGLGGRESLELNDIGDLRHEVAGLRTALARVAATVEAQRTAALRSADDAAWRSIALNDKMDKLLSRDPQQPQALAKALSWHTQRRRDDDITAALAPEANEPPLQRDLV